MALTDTAGGTQTDPGTGKPSENPPADPPSDGPASEKPHDPPADPNKPFRIDVHQLLRLLLRQVQFTRHWFELRQRAGIEFLTFRGGERVFLRRAGRRFFFRWNGLAGVQQQQAESWQKQTEDWAAAVKADKDIGGDKLASNLGAAQRAIDTFGTKELKEYLDGTCARSLVNAAP
ncbi:peptidase [Salmonella enterica subsp. enterica serovar Berta]